MRRLLALLAVLGLSYTSYATITVVAIKTATVAASANLFAETFSLDVAGPSTNWDNAWTDSTSGGTGEADATTNPPVGSGGTNCGGFTGEALKLTAGIFEEPEFWIDFGTAQADEVDFRGYLYIASEDIAVSTVTTIMLIDNASSANILGSGTPIVRLELGETAGDQLQLGMVVATASSAVGTVNVTTGVCYRVEMKWNDTTNAVSFRVDGVDIVVADTSTNPGASSEFIGIGVEATDNATIWWDTIGLGNLGYIGA